MRGSIAISIVKHHQIIGFSLAIVMEHDHYDVLYTSASHPLKHTSEGFHLALDWEAFKKFYR